MRAGNSGQQISRCIRVFPNKESLLRIATALLIELDEKWLANGKVYLKG